MRIFASVVGIMAVAGAAVAGDVQNGKELVNANCSSCHAISGPGPSPREKAPAFETLGKNYPLEALEEALAEGIFVGHEGVADMPEFTFEPEQIDDVIAYLKSNSKH